MGCGVLSQPCLLWRPRTDWLTILTEKSVDMLAAGTQGQVDFHLEGETGCSSLQRQ